MSGSVQSGPSRVAEFLREAKTVDLEIVEIVATQEEADQLHDKPIRPNAILIDGVPLMIPKGLNPKVHEVVVDREEFLAATITFFTRSTSLGLKVLDDIEAQS